MLLTIIEINKDYSENTLIDKASSSTIKYDIFEELCEHSKGDVLSFERKNVPQKLELLTDNEWVIDKIKSIYGLTGGGMIQPYYGKKEIIYYVQNPKNLSYGEKN